MECNGGALIAGHGLRGVVDSDRLVRLSLDRLALDERSVRSLCLVFELSLNCVLVLSARLEQ